MLVGSIAACPRLGLLHLADGLELAITTGKADKHHERNGDRGRGGGSAGVLVHELHALGGKHATVRMQHGRGDIDQNGRDHGAPMPRTTQMAASRPCANTMGAGTSLALAAASERGAEAKETP